MTIVKEYLDYTEKWKKEYGEKTSGFNASRFLL